MKAPKALLFISLVSFAGSIGFAQTDDDDSDIIDLNPFVVEASTQDGYLATNSNSGTRLSEKIKELPIPVEIITGQFIEDIGALNVKEALQFTAGLETTITSQQIGENTNNPNAFRLRGYVSEAVMRNGFRVVGTTDSVNISQVDVVRGPNALLYGIGNFGGVVNYVTLRPLPEFRSSVNLTIGSWDFRRIQIRAQGPVGKKNGYAVGLFNQAGDSWFDNAKSEKKGVTGMWEFKLSPKTTLTFEGEYIYQNNNSAENPLSTAFIGGVVDGDFIDGRLHPTHVLDQEGNNYWADPNTWQGFLVRPDKEFRWSGIDSFSEIRDTSLMVSLVHNFNENLSLQTGYNYVKRDQFNQGLNVRYTTQSILQNSAQGLRLRSLYPWIYLPQHPDYAEWHAPGFKALEYNWNQSENIQEYNMARAEFAWRKEYNSIRHTVIAGMTYSGFRPNQGASFALKDTDRPTGININDISGYENAYSKLKSIFDYTPIRLGLDPNEEFLLTREYRVPSKFWELGYYLIHQAKFWNDKFHTVLGLRYDRIDTSRAQYISAEDLKNPQYADKELGDLREYLPRADGPSTDFNTSIGISFTPNDSFSIFALRASALQPIYNQTTSEGIIPPPQNGISYEVGLKFDLFEQAVSGAVSVYSIERDGVPRRAPVTTYPRDGDNPSDPSSYDADWIGQGRGNSNDFGFMQDTSHGVDMQLYLTDVIDGFQTVFNFSYNQYEWERYYGSSFVRKDGTGEDAVFVFENNDYSSEINPNRKYNDTPEFSVRIWNKYQFRDGFLEGFDIGLGFNWTDTREATYSRDGNPLLDSLKVIPATTEWSAAIGYSRELGSYNVSARLNVYNLFDDDTVIGYAYKTPRNFRLSVNISY